MSIKPSLVKRAVPATVLSALALAMGCQPAPPPPRVPVPSDERSGARIRERDEMRPLPPPNSYDEPNVGRPFEDAPLLAQRPPEQRAFVEAYRNLGAPRIAVLVSGQEGNSTAAIDYEAVETIMSDWFACGGQVNLMAPTLATRRLSESEDRTALAQLGADVTVSVRAAPTPSSRDGKSLRLVAQAINTRGGDSIGRAVVDVPPPLEKSQINDYTRFLARKLMDDMTQTWRSVPPEDRRERRDAFPSTSPSR